MANLHHDGNIELAALGVIGIVLGVIGRQARTSADTGARRRSRHSRPHARGHSRPCMPRNGSRCRPGRKSAPDAPAQTACTARRAISKPPTLVNIAGPHGNQQRAFDSGLVHLQQGNLLRSPRAHVRGHPDLCLELVVQAGPAIVRPLLACIEIRISIAPISIFGCRHIPTRVISYGSRIGYPALRSSSARLLTVQIPGPR